MGLSFIKSDWYLYVNYKQFINTFTVQAILDQVWTLHLTLKTNKLTVTCQTKTPKHQFLHEQFCPNKNLLSATHLAVQFTVASS